MQSFDSVAPFQISVPDAALSTSNGEAIVVLSPATLGVPEVGDVVLKSDLVLMGPIRVDLDTTGDSLVYTLMPMFAGTLTKVSMALTGAETAGSCSVAVSITFGAVTLSTPLSFPIGSLNSTLIVDVTAGGDFAATDIIQITVTSANTSTTFGGVTFGATRA
mgnify:FL=1